jgi:hypothetical protein
MAFCCSDHLVWPARYSLRARMTDRSRVLIFVVSGLLAFGGLAVLPFVVVDALAPSPPPAPDPHELARELSGLTIPAAAHVDTLRWDPSGPSWWARVELTLPSAEMAQVVRDARAKSYREVVGAPRRDERHPDSVDSFGWSLNGAWKAAQELPVGSRGLYRYERATPSRYALVVLDSLRGRFVAELYMPRP